MANYKYYKRYCSDIENVENFEKAAADNFNGWLCHHRLETWTSDGERRAVDIKAAELKVLGMYWNRPAEELIFMKESEHRTLHNKGEKNPMYGRPGPNKGKHFSEEHIKKLSEVHKGKHHSEETRNKMSASHKNISEETRKKMSAASKGNTATKGMHWYNNGKINKVCFECPQGFIPGRLR